MAVDDSYTKVLMHFSDGITDESGKTWTAYGGAATSATGGKFAGRLILDGVDDYISCTHADFAVGSQSFVAECWITPKTPMAGSWIFGFGNGTYNRFGLYLPAASTISLIGSTSGSAWDLLSVVALSAGQRHVAMIKSGNVVCGSIDGVVFGTTTLTGSLLQNTNDLLIGMRPSGTYYYAGDTSEFRLSVGTDRGWTANFTPPTAPYGGAQQYSYAI